MTPEELTALIERRTTGKRPGCGVCLGHSPSWDGHDFGCKERDFDALIQSSSDLLAAHDALTAEVEALRALLPSCGHCGRPYPNAHDEEPCNHDRC